MKIEISVFAAVIILFFLHTVLIHLFNWWFRSSKYDERFPLAFHSVEIIICIALLRNLIL